MVTSPSRFVPLEYTFTHRLHSLTKLSDRLSQVAYLADAGISMSEGRCLAAIGAFSPLSVNDLANQSNLNKSQASRAVQSLVDQGFVNKKTSSTDGRGVVLTLTRSGDRVWRRVMEVIQRRNHEITSCLNPVEKQQLDSLLDRLVVHASEASTQEIERSS